MKKSSLLFCTTLSCILFSGLGVASAVANSYDKNLPKPVVVVAPDNVPRNYVNTTVRNGMTLDENGYPSNIRVVSLASAYLAKSIVPAIAQWRFTPMQVNGKPVTQEVVLPLELKAPAL